MDAENYVVDWFALDYRKIGKNQNIWKSYLESRVAFLTSMKLINRFIRIFRSILRWKQSE